MSIKKEKPKNRVEFNNVEGVMVAFKHGRRVRKDFLTRRKNKQHGTIEFSLDGENWEKLSYFEEGKAKFDENYDPEFDPKETGKNVLVAPGGVRIIKGNV